MNILEITGEPILHGGQESFICSILERIKREDVKIDVLTPYYCNNAYFKDLVSSQNGQVYELHLDFGPGKSRKLIYNPVYKFLNNKKYDIIHIHSGSISVFAYESCAAKRNGIKRIIVHSHSTGNKGIKHILIKLAFNRKLNRCPTHYLACSKEAGMMKFPRSAQKKVVIINNAIDLEKFKRNNEIGGLLRRKYNIPENAYVIGHVGRFTSEKNHFFLIEVFREVYRQLPNSFLLLVGEGELMNDVKDKANKMGIKEHVIYSGVVDNVQDYYNMFNCFVLPSLYEGFPYVTLEAQANGLPCVISTGVPEAVAVTEQIARLELNVDIWADYILGIKDLKTNDNTQFLREKGFDIKESTRIIERIYFQ